jgi:hypothetical protein
MSVDLQIAPKIWMQSRFELKEYTSRGALGSVITQYAFPRWIAEYETRWADRVDIQGARSFLIAQKSGISTHWGFDWIRPRGNAYLTGNPGSLTRAGGGSFGAMTATITAITANTISVSTLPAGYVFTAGDHIGLVQGNNRQCHVVTASVTANASGVATVTVYPPVATTIFSTSSTFSVFRARCVMRVDPGSVRETRQGRFTKLSFTATQVFYS